MSLIVHLGAHKTATTHLARSIRAMDAHLQAADIAFLDPEILRHPPVRLRSLLGDGGARPRHRQAVSAMLHEMAATHARLILSEEQIMGGLADGQLLGADGRIYPMAGRRLGLLLDLLGTRDVTLMLALRSPADFLTSAFGEVLRHDGPLRIEDFLGDFDPVALRWSELVRRLMAETGAARMICWRYEDLAGVRAELLSVMLGEALAARVPDLPPTRIGLSDAAYRALLDQSPGAGADRALTGALRRAHPKRGVADALRVLPREVHVQCDRLYRQDCARIAAMAGVTFLRPSGQEPWLGLD